jgi:hypothetical protein
MLMVKMSKQLFMFDQIFISTLSSDERLMREGSGKGKRSVYKVDKIKASNRVIELGER